MNSQKKPFYPAPHFHGPVESDLFCPRYRMADRPDLYMWDGLEGTGGPSSTDVGHMEPNTGMSHWAMNRPPPPLAHTGHGSLFPSHPHVQPSTPGPSRPQEGLGGGGGGHMGSTGLSGTPTPSSGVSSTSPLVVPQPMKARTIKTYHCRMCDQIFDSKSDLLVHSQQVHKQDPKPYKCPTCNKCFANSSYLSQHARIHSGIKPYKCQICERRFTQLCHLQQHIRTHTGEKPYKCQHPGCGKAFSQLSNLQSHSRSHMTDKPYRCNSCYKCFSDEQQLREHIPKHSETKHIKTHICRVCGKAYTQETYLARHMTKHTADPHGGAGAHSHHPGRNQLGLGGGPPGCNKPSVGGLGSPGGGPSQHPDSTDIRSPMDGGNGHLGGGHSGGGGGGPGGPSGPGGPVGLGVNHGKPSSSAFMPLGHQFPNPGLTNSSVPSPSAFPFMSPRLPNNTLNSSLSHMSPSSTSRGYPFPFDPMTFPKGRNPLEPRMGMSHDDMIANSLISLQQIKNFSTSHPVFPKSEPSSPLHKDFP